MRMINNIIFKIISKKQKNYKEIMMNYKKNIIYYKIKSNKINKTKKIKNYFF